MSLVAWVPVSSVRVRFSAVAFSLRRGGAVGALRKPCAPLPPPAALLSLFLSQHKTATVIAFKKKKTATVIAFKKEKKTATVIAFKKKNCHRPCINKKKS